MICKQVVVCLILAGVAVAGSEPISSGKFRSPLLKRNLDFRVFAPVKASATAMPMVVYLKNLGIERIGKVSDSKLIGGFLDRGMLVVEVDYQSNAKAKGGDMYADIVYLYSARSLRGNPSSPAVSLNRLHLWTSLSGGTRKRLKLTISLQSSAAAKKLSIKLILCGYM